MIDEQALEAVAHATAVSDADARDLLEAYEAARTPVSLPVGDDDLKRMAWTGFENGYMAASPAGVLAHETILEAWLRSETYRINWGDLAGEQEV